MVANRDRISIETHSETAVKELQCESRLAQSSLAGMSVSSTILIARNEEAHDNSP